MGGLEPNQGQSSGIENIIDRRHIAARFFAAADKFADLPAMGVSGEDAFLTYRQMADQVLNCAAFLGRLEPQTPVGLLSENRPEWGKVYLAILTIGGLVVPIDPLLKEQELARVFIESGIKKLIVSSKYFEMAGKAAASLEKSIEIIDLEAIPTSHEGYVIDIPDNLDLPAAMIFTSGTTGKSKKVILTHNNIISDIEGIMKRLRFGPGDRFLSVLPLHHTFEATCGFIAPLTQGSAIYYVRELNSREIMNGIKKHQITYFISVPLLYEKLYHAILNAVKKAPRVKRAAFKMMMSLSKIMHSLGRRNAGRKIFASFRKKAGLDSIRLMVSGGAPLPAEISRNFGLMGFGFIEGYGLTETGPVLSANPPGRVKYGSVGPALENVKVKIDNPNEKGIGELLVQGPMVTPGYKDNPEATEELLAGGWLHTGDMARIDNEGYIYIVGRAKNLIVTAAGKNVYPEEIEAELLRSRFILESIVYGKMGTSGREEVSAIIYPDFKALAVHLNKPLGENDQIDPEIFTAQEIKAVLDAEVKEICRNMADFKRIKNTEYIRTEFEKTSTRKIKRHKHI
jgi:long-chain acyl-CoA synthetase